MHARMLPAPPAPGPFALAHARMRCRALAVLQARRPARKPFAAWPAHECVLLWDAALLVFAAALAHACDASMRSGAGMCQFVGGLVAEHCVPLAVFDIDVQVVVICCNIIRFLPKSSCDYKEAWYQKNVIGSLYSSP
jgi:hypothetical protein